MTEHGPRTGPARDVPPPRPVVSPGPAPEEAGLGRAARAGADAVGGILGAPPGRPEAPTGTPRRSAAAGLRDVVGAVAGAVGAAFAPDRQAGTPSPAAGTATPPGDAERSPGALLGDLLTSAAPRLPIRDAVQLRQAYPGASDEEIADALVARAARLTAGNGAGTGGLSAARWFAPVSLLTLPSA